ncbi:hypothetical protein ACH5RR_016020 [Cinchona calisaya]|uniref:Uncharacterized protein n=1 Tax=Cinchona calisaya TaxID=153742 RepID=A0ABD2ZUQ3_9GENT
MDRQEHALSDLIDRLGELPVGYNILQDLQELMASFSTLKDHVNAMSGLAKVNGIDVIAMVGTSATHSFMSGQDVQRLNLDLKKNDYRIKVMNSEAHPILVLATVELTLGPWVGRCNLMPVPLDDFDLILRKKFIATNKIFSVPHLNGVMVADEREYVATLVAVELDFVGKIKDSSPNDIVYQKMMKQVKNELVHRYWRENRHELASFRPLVRLFGMNYAHGTLDGSCG